MAHDVKLVEAMCRAACVRRGRDPDAIRVIEQAPEWTVFREDMIAALTAVNATCTHWVAPWEAPLEIVAQLRTYPPTGALFFNGLWVQTRDAYLAEQDKADGCDDKKLGADTCS